jgi:hypothetical protein
MLTISTVVICSERPGPGLTSETSKLGFVFVSEGDGTADIGVVNLAAAEIVRPTSDVGL